MNTETAVNRLMLHHKCPVHFKYCGYSKYWYIVTPKINTIFHDLNITVIVNIVYRDTPITLALNYRELVD